MKQLVTSLSDLYCYYVPNISMTYMEIYELSKEDGKDIQKPVVQRAPNELPLELYI